MSPKDVTERLGVSKGDAIIFEEKNGEFLVKKVASKNKRLEALMNWNPKRTGKPESVTPRRMKKIWKT